MKKNINPIKKETAAKRLGYMYDKTSEDLKSVENLHVFISEGNTKTGNLVASVSLRPVLDCCNCKQCCKLCYDLRNDMYKTVMNTRAKNAAIYKADPDRYFREISAACNFYVAFRWHVGGDIVDNRYFAGMIQVAKDHPNTKFLAFTKAFDIVNSYLDAGGVIPENFQIIFSGWVGLEMNNPYNLPTSHPVFIDGQTSAPADAKQCTGNCSECLIKGQNCWTLKNGESVKFDAH